MGFSLHRINDAQFGNDPVNWTAAAPTPGSPRVPGGPPTIVSQPASLTSYAGQTASLSVVAGGPGPYRYQWRLDGNNLPGATSDTLVLSNVQVDQSGDYQVVVLNDNGSVASSIATLSIYQAVTILSQPTGRGVGLGSNTTFVVNALGNGPVTYQWRFNGTILSDATNPSLSLTNVQLTDEGDYDCLVADAVGLLNTAPAHLSVLLKPSVVQQLQPALQTVLAGEDATFSIIAGGTSLGFRWRRNGSTFTNAIIVNTQVAATQTLSSITVTNLSYLNDADRYTVVVTNTLGQFTSGNGVLRVLYAPVITKQPTNQYVNAGTNAAFSATFQANPIVTTYQWWFNATNLVATGTNALGTNTASLVVTNVQATNEGLYSLTVSNDYGVTVSTGALLALRRLPEILRQPASQSATVGATVTFSVIATGAPPPTYRWRFNGSNLPAAGAISATLTLTNVQISQAGDYDVVLTNSVGSVTSLVATLTLQQAATITGAVFDTVSGNMKFSFVTVSGATYLIEYKNALDDPAWQTLQTIPGDGSVKTFEDPVQQPPPSQRFYRVRTE